jgi:quinol monooxygenase YgiN
MAASSGAILRLVRLTFKAENVETFLQFFSETAPHIRAFEGCIELQGFRDREQPNVVYTLSRWASPEHLENYRQSTFFKNTWEQVSRWFEDKPQAFTLVPFAEASEQQ